MRIAICLSGKIGGLAGKNGEGGGEEILLALGYSHMVRKVLSKNKEHQIDFFIHCWDKDFEEDLIALYNPVSIKTEDQIKFNIPDTIKGDSKDQPTRRNNHFSRWYSFQKSVNLKIDYELSNNFKYDGVLSTRFDLCWDFDVDFNKLSPSNIWHSDITYYHDGTKKHMPFALTKESKSKMKKITKTRSGATHMWDTWFYSSSKITDQISKLFENIEKINKKLGNKEISNHKMLPKHINMLGHSGKLKLYGEWDQCAVARWHYKILYPLQKHKYDIGKK